MLSRGNVMWVWERHAEIEPWGLRNDELERMHKKYEDKKMA